MPRTAARPAPVTRRDRRARAARPRPGACGSPPRARARPPPPLDVLRGQQVDLVQHDEERALLEPGAVALELAAHGSERRPRGPTRRSARCRRRARAGCVRSTCARNSCPSPAPSAAPSIRPGMSASTSWRPVVVVDRAESRLERGERIVGDLGAGPRQAPQQRRLAGVRQPHEPDVREQLQPQLERRLLAGQAVLGESRRLPGRGREAPVARAPAAAARDHDALCRRASGRGVIPRARSSTTVPHGTLSSRSPPAAPWRCDPSPWPPRFALKWRWWRNCDRSRRPGSATQHDVAAAPAVAAVGAALGHVRLTAEADAAVAASSCLDVDCRAVVEHGPQPSAWQCSSR